MRSFSRAVGCVTLGACHTRGCSTSSSSSPPSPPSSKDRPASPASVSSAKEESAKEDDDVVTPWTVSAQGPKGVNYDRVMTRFKSEPVDAELMDRMAALAARWSERLGKPAPSANPLHHFFRRGVAFSHRDMHKALGAVERSMEPGVHQAYLYTGRGPSAESMHVGHVIPFLLTRYMQEAFGLPLVIQITDDEKYLFRDVPFEGERADELINNNIKDIIAFGFNPKTTFIFRNTQYFGEMYKTVLKVQHSFTGSAVKNTFGITDSDNIGKMAFPATQAAPCFATAFARVLCQNDPRDLQKMQCIIPCAIDQDPYFVLTRNIASRLKSPPPALVHTKFLPALKGMTHKMSSSASDKGVITLHDTDDQIRKKMRKAFSGGSGTLQEMREQGANVETDVAYQFIRFFSSDDELVADAAERYRAGLLDSGSMKALAASVVIDSVLADWRVRRETVTDEDVEHFCSIRNILF